MFSSKKERDAARTAVMKPGYYGQFPSTFALYYLGHGTDFLSLNFFLSSMEPRNNLYAVTFHKGPGSVQVTIYSDPTHGSTPMAIATNEKRYGSSTMITLPCVDGGTQRTERLQNSGFNSNAHTFSFHGQNFEIREQPKKRPKTIQVVRVETPKLDGGEDEATQGPVEPSTSSGCHVEMDSADF